MPLKYLFIAEYKDGSLFFQDLEDRSKNDPTKSAYFDLKLDNIKTFTLMGEHKRYTVNLEDGHFEVNGIPFWAHEDAGLKDFRLIFFRRHRHDFNQADGKEIAHRVTYRLGWQCTVEGKNYQQVIQID